MWGLKTARPDADEESASPDRVSALSCTTRHDPGRQDRRRGPPLS